MQKLQTTKVQHVINISFQYLLNKISNVFKTCIYIYIWLPLALLKAWHFSQTLCVCVIRMQCSQNKPTREFRTVTKSKDLTPFIFEWLSVKSYFAPCLQENSIWWKRLDISVRFHIRVYPTNKWSAKGGSCDRTMTRESCTVSTDQPVNSPCLVPLCQYRAISAAVR